jgi:hypothetical protein
MRDHSNLSCGIPAVIFTAMVKPEFDARRQPAAVMQW